jgi:hypothetical protein
MKKHLKNYFIPNEKNQFKPHSLEKKNIASLFALIFVFELLYLVTVFTPIGIMFKNNMAAILPSILVMETNQEREYLNLNQLQTSPLLETAAQIKADDMAVRSFFAHVNPDGKQPWFYLDLAGYGYRAAGENLAVNFIHSKDVHRAWMKSPTHKANIVQEKFTEIGIATSRGLYKGEEVVFVVQFFGLPNENNLNPNPLYVNTGTSSEEFFAARESKNNPEVLGLSIIKSDPTFVITNLIYALLGLMFLALILKVSVKPSVQYKELIINGLVFIAVLLIILAINIYIKSYFAPII